MEREELVSSMTHLMYAAVAVFLTVVAIFKGVRLSSPYHIVSYSIFGASMILLYLASGFYHLIPKNTKAKLILKKVDHIMIFFMIAGTYTPFCLITLNGGWGWSIFGTIWGLALSGLIFKLFFINAPRILYTSIYLIMGWIVIVAIYPIYKNLSASGLLWLVAGGIFYTVGAVIYAIKKPNPIPGVFGFHEIWHIFVILGTTAHFVSVYFYT